MKKFFLFFIFLFFISIFPFVSSYSCENIISYYPLDDVSNPFTNDSKGDNDGVNLESYGFMQNATGKYNRAYMFHNELQPNGVFFIDSNFYDYLDYNQSWAVAMWVKPYQAGTNAGIRHLFGQQTNPVSHTTKGISIFYINGLIFLQMNAGACGYQCNELQTSSSYTMDVDDRFYFVVINYFGNYSGSGVEIWIDGINYGSSADADSLSASYLDTNVNFTLGIPDDEGSATATTPYLDDVYIFSSTLSEQQIIDMNNSENPFFNSCDELAKSGNIPNQSLYFNDSLTINASEYFLNWYDIALISIDPLTSNKSVTITGAASIIAPFYGVSITTGGIIGIGSYFTNYFENIDVFACSNAPDGIDIFCPLEDFPESCNISAFYTADSCLNSNFTLNISDTYIAGVEVIAPFSLYYRLDDYEHEVFNFNSFFRNYNTINVKYRDIGISSNNQSLTCVLGNIAITNKTGILNTSFSCENYNAILTIYSNNISKNITFWVTASNSNNSLSDFFIISTGLITIPENVFNKYLNFSKIMLMFPIIEEQSHANLTALIFIVAILIIGIMFIGIPLKFSSLSLFLIALLTLFSIFLMAYIQWIGFIWLIIPLVLLVAYILIKFIFKGS